MGVPAPSTTHTWGLCRPLLASVSPPVLAFVPIFLPLVPPESGWGGHGVNLSSGLILLWGNGAAWWWGGPLCSRFIPSPSAEMRRCLFVKWMSVSPPLPAYPHQLTIDWRRLPSPGAWRRWGSSYGGLGSL